jgi:hypothetical protein
MSLSLKGKKKLDSIVKNLQEEQVKKTEKTLTERLRKKLRKSK